MLATGRNLMFRIEWWFRGHTAPTSRTGVSGQAIATPMACWRRFAASACVEKRQVTEVKVCHWLCQCGTVPGQLLKALAKPVAHIFNSLPRHPVAGSRTLFPVWSGRDLLLRLDTVDARRCSRPGFRGMSFRQRTLVRQTGTCSNQLPEFECHSTP